MEKNGIATSVIKRIEELAVPLRAFGDKAWSVLSFSPAADLVAPRCISFSIEPGCVRAVCGSRSFSRYRVHECKTYTAATKDYPAADEVASMASVAFAEMHGDRAEIVLIIPKAWVLVRSAMLPLAASENLQQVLSFEFDRLTPFSADEAAFDFLVRPPAADGIPITLAAAKISVVMDYVSALAEKGLVVSRVGVDVAALSSLIRFVTASDSFSFVSLAFHGIRGGITDTGILQSVFELQADEGDTSLVSAAVREHALQVASGDGNAGAELPGYLLVDQSTAHLKNSVASESGFAYQSLETAEVRIEGVDSFATGYETAVGGLVEYLWKGAHGFDLLSQGVRRKVRPPLVLTAFLTALLLICAGIYIFMPLQVEEQRLKEIERQIALRKDEVRAVEKLKKEIEDITRETALVDNFRKEKPLYMDIAREITQIIPKNAWLTRVRIAGNLVNLEGYSPSASGLIEVLEASKFFQKVEFASPTFRDARLNTDRFQIKMELEGVIPEKRTNEKK